MHICRICGDREENNWSPRWRDYLERCHLCCTCGHYINTSETAKEGSLVVIDGKMYVLGPDDPDIPDSWKGHGGRKFTVQFLDGREVVTHDLWYAGDIPEALLERFPDNAEFVEVEK